MNRLNALLALVMVLALQPAHAQASGQASQSMDLRVRAKAGYSFVSDHRNFGPYGLDEVSAGLDVGYALSNQFELALSVSRVFLAAGSWVYAVGVSPSWSILDEGRFHIFGGIFSGLVIIHQEYPSMVFPYGYTVISATRYALGPVLGADIGIFRSLFGNISLQYAKAFGPEGNLGVLGLMAGFGYRL